MLERDDDPVILIEPGDALEHLAATLGMNGGIELGIIGRLIRPPRVTGDCRAQAAALSRIGTSGLEAGGPYPGIFSLA